jgi:hypothetical protein
MFTALDGVDIQAPLVQTFDKRGEGPSPHLRLIVMLQFAEPPLKVEQR